ncbi:MAG: branched-chain amino acid ABC transporter permease [Candidatus Caldarchaeum sp.]
MISFENLVVLLVYGATLSGVWALISSGFTLIFGVCRLLNLAHGGLFIAGAYIGLSLIKGLGLDPLTSTVLSMIAVGFIGSGVYTGLLMKVKEHEVTVVIITLALALIIEQVILLMFGEHGIIFPPILAGVVYLGDVPLPAMRIFGMAIALAALFLLGLFVTRTRIGREITAASQDVEAATFIGLDVNRLFIVTMFISSLLAGLGGVLYSQIYAANPFLVLKALIFAFAIVILGGLGSVKGSIVASFIVGYIMTVVIMFLGARWSELFALLIIIAALIIRPSGLFGVRE